MAGTFNIKTSETDKFVRAINKGLTHPDSFWTKEGENKYVSCTSLGEGADTITLLMTRSQWFDLTNHLTVRD